MSLMLEGPRGPAQWAPENNPRLLGSRDGYSGRPECVHIGIVNNMPDAALEDTASQFFELLDTASGDIPVRVQLYSLPEIARGERARQQMNGLYFDVRDLPGSGLDALIITGTEPREPDLRKEAYWRTLIDLLGWAERNTTSTVLSCLAAHASVLHRDGIERHLLSDKRFGVFDERKVSDHFLVSGASDILRIPHSRWNEVREDDLVSCGYTVVTKSRDAGVGLFTKEMRKSLFVHFQGHPEYAARTFLKEYRRDVKRFLRKERETYPSMPRGYFDAPAAKLLAGFRERALSDPREDALQFFPDAAIAATPQNGWHAAGARVYRNWLQHVVSKKAEATDYSVMAKSAQAQRKGSVAS